MKEHYISTKEVFNTQAASVAHLFFQNGNLMTTDGTEKHLSRDKLINKLNYLNFTGGLVSIIFRHVQGDDNILIHARPHPCVGTRLACRLLPENNASLLAADGPLVLLIDDGLHSYLAPLESPSFNGHDLTAKLPQECLIKTFRSVRRGHCHDVTSDIFFEDTKHKGTLIDFSPVALSIRLTDTQGEKQTQPPKNARIDLSRGNVRLFSGNCRLIRSELNTSTPRVVYKPTGQKMHLYPQRPTRNPRRHITPSFLITFHHPLTGRLVSRDAHDVSASGFSIKETLAEQTLMTGMVLPEVSIEYAGIIRMECSAQVVYQLEDTENNMVQSGVAITDIDVPSYTHLNHLVGMHLDAGAHVSTAVDMDALWEFFFDTGFIYGEKYQHLYPNRESFAQTYRKLYRDSPEIARHFTYQKNGKIYGHIAMVHAYPRSWVIHHFSARPLEAKVPGMLVLRQIMHFLNGCHRFASFGMKYIMTYYRPDNKLVDRIFGGFARDLGNPSGSSLDLFSYLHFDRTSHGSPMPEGFTLRECLPDDFTVFRDFYQNSSGGLLFDAFRPDMDMQPLEEKFQSRGFKRGCRTYCLCRKDKHLAFLLVNQSDLGLNLSDLLNGIHVFIIDEKTLEWPVLQAALSSLSGVYSVGRIPTLVYPATYLAREGVTADKQYQLWIMTGDPYSELFTDYMRRKFRVRYEEPPKK
ncbi:MAG TPA: PilZ domain-containing protein [Smithellaceae bacterium]|nr:PilZ domain-containing protein [Smithellaceae bacterium]